MMQVDNIIELGGEVRGGGDKQCLSRLKETRLIFFFMGEEFFHFLSGDGIVETDGTVVKGHKEGLVEVEPYNVGGFDDLPIGLFGQINLQPENVRQIIPRSAGGSIIDGNLGIVVDKGIIDGGEHLGSFGPGDTSGRSVVGECVDDLTCFTVPEVDGSILHISFDIDSIFISRPGLEPCESPLSKRTI